MPGAITDDLYAVVKALASLALTSPGERDRHVTRWRKLFHTNQLQRPMGDRPPPLYGETLMLLAGMDTSWVAVRVSSCLCLDVRDHG